MKLHHKFITPLLIGFFLLCAACHNNNHALEKELGANLDNSNKFINDQIDRLLGSIESEEEDPKSHWKIAIWLPRVKAIHELSKIVYHYIDSIKARPELQTRLSLDTLLAKIDQYRRTIPDILLNDSFPSPNIREDFEKNVKRFNVEFPFATTDRIGTVSATASPVVCNKIKNDMLLCEYYLVEYLYKKIGTTYDGYSIYGPLIHQNYSSLKKGQRLIITAGIGAYSSATKTVTIDGRQLIRNAEGYTQYSIIAKGTPGKHRIPVKIEYTLPDGTLRHYTQNVEYEITP